MRIPNELILAIASFLDCERDISSLSQTSKVLYTVLNPYLYRHNVQTSNSSALLWAAENGHRGVAEKILRAGGAVTIRTRSPAGETPLHLAVRYRQLSMARWLLEYCGMDPNCLDVHGRTPLIWACKQGNEDMVVLLLKQPWIQPDFPGTPNALLQSGRYYGLTPLASAVFYRHEKIVERLIGLDVDLNSRYVRGITPLYLAVMTGNIPLVRLLLATPGVDPNLSDKRDGMAPLHYAASKGNLAIVELLLAVEDIDIDVKDRSSWTPLFYAAKKGHEAVVKVLLDKGCDPNPCDLSALHASYTVATASGLEHIAHMILERIPPADLASFHTSKHTQRHRLNRLSCIRGCVNRNTVIERENRSDERH